MAQDEIVYFESSAAFRAWLKKNGAKAPELNVGFVKRHAVASGNGKSMTWPESVAEALCFGWIDGVRWRVDEERYAIRFSPRRAGSKWSAINVRMVKELEAAGRMTAAGRAVFEARKHREGYTYEVRAAEMDAAAVRVIKKSKKAWEFLEEQPPHYRKLVAWSERGKRV